MLHNHRWMTLLLPALCLTPAGMGFAYQDKADPPAKTEGKDQADDAAKEADEKSTADDAAPRAAQSRSKARRSGRMIPPRVGASRAPDGARQDSIKEPADKAAAGRKPQRPVSSSMARKSAKGGPFEPNPNARFACDKTVATAEPVWRGQSSLEFTFMIRNEGTEPLEIRAKGG